jgi:hypothetical protein
MRTQTGPFRLISAIAVAALALAQTLPSPALAQPAPPPYTQQSGDPPTRVGRLAQINGTVSYHTLDETQWSPAMLNYPVSQGNSFWTQPNAQASIEVSASRIVMAPETELDVASLTDSAFQATVPQGEVYLHVQSVTPNEAYSVLTPRGVVTLASPGRYGIATGDTNNPTQVTVVQGSAHIEAPGVSLDVAANQTATIAGTDTFQGNTGPMQPDPFLSAMLNAERAPAAPPPAAVAAIPGGQDLSAYGTWTDTTDYGQVWYPQVAPDWVPYQEGQWAYVTPWGWTWVDSDPWGFAPFHYGRWVQSGGRWGWIPGAPVAGPPVYAPALVAFFGIGAAVGVGIGAALAAGRIGWCPLGPREVYQPWYHASPGYIRQVNINHVTNFTTINRNVTINNFVNRRATTVVPASALTGSRPVARFAQRADPAQLAQAHPVMGVQPLRPTFSTAGVTPAVARQFNLEAPAAGARPAAPGPAVHATPMVTGPHPNFPALPSQGQPAVPAATAIHPIAPGMPALRAPATPNHAGPPPIEHAAPVVAPGAVPHPIQPPPASVHPAAPVQPVAPQFHPAPNAIEPQHLAPVMQQPRVNVPPPVAHPAPAVVAPAPVPQIQHAAQPPAVHAAPPPVVQTAPPPQVVHAPPPEVHAAPPPPAIHTPPPAAPMARPAPAPAPRPAPAHEEQRKQPGQQ